MINRLNIYILALCVALISGCRKSDDIDLDANTTEGVISISTTLVEQSITGRYYDIMVNSDYTSVASCDASWIEISDEDVDADGTFEFYITDNYNDDSRETTIVFTSHRDGVSTAILEVKQFGYSDMSSNAVAGGLTEDFRVGWGYNIFKDYSSTRALTNQVLDYNNILMAESDLSYDILQEDRRNVEELSIISGYTLSELSSSLTSSVDSSTSILGCGSTVSKYTQTSSESIDERCFGYSRFQKTVASRYIDEMGLYNLIEGGVNLFTEDFLSDINSLKSNCSDSAVASFVGKWGSHMVINSNIGGMIEFYFDFEKSMVTNVSTYTEVSTKKALGFSYGETESSDTITESYSKYTDAGSSVDVSAGDSSAKLQSLITEVVAGGGDSTKVNEEIATWLTFLESLDYTDVGNQSEFTVVSCNLIPLWNLISDEVVSQAIMTYVYKYAETNSVFTPYSESVNEYSISLSNSMLSFTDDGTQIKVIYDSQSKPILELCNEFMPDIRTDKRVVVAYPIINGVPNYSRGVFLGDGESNPPAYVSFEGSYVYISPISSYSTSDTVSTLYYIYGSLYTTDLGLGILKSSVSCKEYSVTVMDIYGNTQTMAAIKIGSDVWTRSYIGLNCGFKANYDAGIDANYYKYTESGVATVYMHQYATQLDAFYDVNKGIYGEDYWYIPKTEDIEDLMSYLYKSPKNIFKGQVSGFDAQFMGYYGWTDPISGVESNTFGRHYVGEYCFIPCKDGDYTGSTLALDTNYNISEIVDKASYCNYYPIRLHRSSNFSYSN